MIMAWGNMNMKMIDFEKKEMNCMEEIVASGSAFIHLMK